MKILGIDTSSKRCTVCILEDNNVIIELHSDDEKTHSQILMPLIDKIFRETNLSLKDVELLACCIGPGSFTGVRIGISTAKAFTDVYNFKTVGVSSLEGLAYNVKDDINLLNNTSETNLYQENAKNVNEYTNKNNPIICSLIDAKNENVYYGLFDENFNHIESLSTCPIDELIDKLKGFNKPIAFIGDGAIAYKEKLKSSLTSTNFFEGEKNLASSISIAKFAYTKYVNGNYNSFLSPMYLKKSQAERSLEERKDC